MQERNNWLMATHLSAFLGYFIPFGNVLAPLALWQIKQDEIPEIIYHAKAVLNFQITMTLAGVVFVLILGKSALAVIAVFALVQIVFGALKANKGELHNYLLSFEFIK